MQAHCAECKKLIDTQIKKFCSRACFHKNYGKNHRKENSPRWKGNKVEYSGIHRWLKRTYDQIDNKCEHCKGNKNLQWALAKEKQYKRSRDSFIRLCASCHKNYDMTDETRKKMSLSKIGKISNRIINKI